MNTVERLKAVLKDQVEGYQALRDILQRERERLVQLDAAAVEQLSKEKDTAVLRLRLLEQERLRVTAALAAERSAPPDATLQQLANLTGDPSFRGLRLQLLSLLQGISELNEFNRILIERSSGMVRNAIGFLSAVGLDLSRRETGTLCSREA